MDLELHDHFVDALPGDASDVPRSRQVERAAYSRVAPTPVAAPRVIAVSPETAALLGLDPEALRTPAAAALFSGNRRATATPYAMCYGGHQFGSWAGQLGDGRAINLGEREHGGVRYTLQLKGAGPTPYSRGSDGRAVLRSSIREFLCSEAMHHLGVPTTRALTLVQTGDEVVRDMFYDGHPRPEPGAIVCRVAESFLRFGNYEIFTARRDEETLRALVDYTITTHFPALGPPSPEVYLAWFAEVVERTARTIVDWMRVGFVHGVMNTDNLSILGLTIDYGPYGWLDDYDPSWTPNTTDARTRRYCYGNQPRVGYWNLMQLANAIAPLFDEVEGLQAALDRYPALLDAAHTAMTAAKLGLGAPRDGDDALMNDLMTTLTKVETDWTIFFRRLAAPAPTLATIADAFYAAPEEAAGRAFTEWLARYAARVADRPDRASGMNAVNPKYVLRNYLAQEAIDLAEAGDPSRVVELLDVMRRPYDAQPDYERYAGRRPDWARERAGCSMLSCSS